jgi:poly(hydroxyalkanoate) granule-associated protein
MDNPGEKPEEKTSSARPRLPFFEAARKVMLASIGAAALAQDEGEEFINRLIERGEIAEQDGRKLMHEMMDKRKQKMSKVQGSASSHIEEVLQRMNVPTKADIEMLSQKVAELAEKLDALKKE